MNHIESVRKKEPVLVFDGLLFRLRDIELIRADSDWRTEQQFAASHVLMTVSSGQGSLTMDSLDCRLRPDAAIVCPPGQTYGISAEKNDGMKLFLLRFDALRETEHNEEGVRYVKEACLQSLTGELPVYPAGQMAALCESIYSQWHSQDGLERYHSQLAFQEMLYFLLKNSFRQPEDSRTSLELAKAHMEQCYNENLTIEQLARIADISPKYFVDLFKKTYGTSAIDYLTELRINRAKQFMAQSGAKLRDIAHQVGYNDEFYFSRKFKKEVGVTPTVYLKSRRRKIAAYGSAITGQLLALKIIPYAAPLHPKWTAYYYKKYRSDIPVHLSAYRKNQHWESNIETLQLAHPDLVISMDELKEGEKERLDQISSVFYVPETVMGWREHLRLTGEFLGESAEAELWLRSYDRKVKSAREQLQHAVKEDQFLIVRISKQRLYIHCNRSMKEVFYEDLQLAPAYLCDSVYDQPITLEQLAGIDADRLLLMVFQENETLAYWQALQHSIMWQELKAVRNNRVYPIPSHPWREYSAVAHERIVDESLMLLSGNRPK
ncbi:ABC transporter substrate-binding protein [Paenibacillus sepulcri]|uniref:AraC family transcriptional regulator n=1 Tax=Paenibacillus sepulcri TaxID=359917 RepID=A0ABS7C8N3_9BACL|nr:AraC family transcriptional regulator [Paenibacillus sepulcri]